MVITIWKRGTVSFSSLYGNGDSHMEMGISKGCANPCFHMVITIWKRGAVSFSSLWSITITRERENFDFLSKIWGKILFNA
jgi:hypothetical protein